MVGLVEESATMRVTHREEARMRGDDHQQAGMWSYIAPEQRVPADHPLRPIRAMVDTILAELSPAFAPLYSPVGRPSIPPEKLLRALLQQVLYSTRSERLLMEQLDYNLLFRWFVGLNMDDAVWDPTVFTKNRERLLAGDIAEAFFARVLAQARQRGLLSDEHFTVDGTLIEAWASLKSFKRTDAPVEPPDDPGNPTVDFHGERRSNVTHGSTTDPDARLVRKAKGHEAKLAYQGHVLMDNRHGLAVEGCVTRASGYGERAAALEMLGHVATTHRVTVGADKGYDTRDFVEALRLVQVTPQGSAPGPRSSRRRGEVAEADQVVDRQAEDEHPVHASPAAMARLAQQADGLEPAEDLFDALAFPLADSVPGVAGGALIDRTRPIRGVLRHVRRHLDEPEGLDEVPRVIAFVGPDGDPVRGRHVAEHLQRRGALPVPARPGDAALDRQAVAIVHEHVPLIGELGLVALRFADQPRVGV